MVEQFFNLIKGRQLVKVEIEFVMYGNRRHVEGQMWECNNYIYFFQGYRDGGHPVSYPANGPFNGYPYSYALFNRNSGSYMGGRFGGIVGFKITL